MPPSIGKPGGGGGGTGGGNTCPFTIEVNSKNDNNVVYNLFFILYPPRLKF